MFTQCTNIQKDLAVQGDKKHFKMTRVRQINDEQLYCSAM